MSSDGASVTERLKHPEYTGENRCWPCTVLNLGIAAVGCSAAALLAVELGGVLFGLSLAAIYFKGYLVPGTPALTARYLPEPVLRAFGKEAASPRDPAADQEWETIERVRDHRENAVDVDEYLREGGVVEGGDDERALTDEFRSALAERVDPAAEASAVRDGLATLFDVSPAEITPEDEPYPAFVVERRVRHWPSQSALAVDLAADAVLRERREDWPTVPLEQRLDALGTVRTLTERCPACGGTVAETSDTVEACCGVHEVVGVQCVDCGARLAELDATTDEAKLTS
ncbi:hypothetical protein ACFQL1_04645 [Halomicroarcula sp. GCM10025709]|uniref:hypothetical protein n=1 Tax=Haloarcula TaxID=2237 RepID=UPI0024C398B2|nr:hypothetical protein [Halomicroarcula sp. YJ-61-S]